MGEFVGDFLTSKKSWSFSGHGTFESDLQTRSECRFLNTEELSFKFQLH